MKPTPEELEQRRIKKDRQKKAEKERLRKHRNETMKSVDDVIEFLIDNETHFGRGPDLKKCHQILDAAKEMLTLHAMCGYCGLEEADHSSVSIMSKVVSSGS